MPPTDNTPDKVSEWLSEHFIASYERDVDPSIWTPVPYPGGVHHRGFGAIMLLTLQYCDAMAGLIAGHASSAGTEATVRFLENEVAPHTGSPVVSARYEARAAALFHMYRHGPAHQREPHLLEWDGMIVAWSMSRGGPPDSQLLLRRGSPWFHLHVDADLLNAHVLAAFRAIRDRVRNDTPLAQRIYDGATEAITPQAPACGKNGHVGRRLSAMLLNPDQ